MTYHHALELAPTQEIRDLQKREDQDRGEGKRERQGLSAAFREAYAEHHLVQDTLPRLLDALALVERDSVVALFCVEGPVDACHRSLVAEHIEHATGQLVSELTLKFR